MINNKTSYCFLLVSIFFTSVMSIEAQQADYYINPKNKPEGITIQQEADFSKNDYEYVILNSLNAPIRSRWPLYPSGVRERFISNLDELKVLDELRVINKDFLEINWTGMETDGITPVRDGPYRISIYEINKNKKRDIKIYTYTVMVDKEEVIFNIQLNSDTIFRRFKDVLVCNVTPSSAEAYVWKAKIYNNNTTVKEQTFSSGYDMPFPGFFWNDYNADGPEGQQFSVIVEATDRAGNTSIQTANFRLTNGERVERAGGTNTGEPPVTIILENKTENYLSLRPEDYIIYNVKRGDYLAKIAREYYGSAPLWGIIYEINRNRLPQHNDPNLILPRTQLILPTKKFMADLLKAGSQTPIR